MRNLSLFFASPVILLLPLLFLVCGHDIVTHDNLTGGSIEFRIIVQQTPLAKTAAPNKSFFDSLIVEISGDFGQMREARRIDLLRPTIIDTIGGIPPGTTRQVRVWTVNQSGDTVHIDTEEYRTVRIERGLVSQVDVELIPALGSIYIQLTTIPNSIDSIFASFTSFKDQRVWEKRVERIPRVFIALDNIPHNTKGMLSLIATGKEKADTLFFAEEELTVSARSLSESSIQFFSAKGYIMVSAELILPGVTLISSSLNSNAFLREETGEVIITEIMYAATNSEYIEIYNPGESEVYFDTLFVELDGTAWVHTEISIPPHSYFVIGRKEMPWADTWHSNTAAVNLVGTGGEIIIMNKDSTVLDRVVYSPGSAGLEWPVISGRRSLELNREYYSARANNFGRHWFASVTEIENSGMFGTPGY
ncbi:hypothetical protein CHISP_1238 [Chitinispirillum alkaliphilum]|nr:hypothetical protein CHISP_1238 [Chitinispirillum alkaliphilum]